MKTKSLILMIQHKTQGNCEYVYHAGIMNFEDLICGTFRKSSIHVAFSLYLKVHDIHESIWSIEHKDYKYKFNCNLQRIYWRICCVFKEVWFSLLPVWCMTCERRIIGTIIRVNYTGWSTRMPQLSNNKIAFNRHHLKNPSEYKTLTSLFHKLNKSTFFESSF